MKRNGFTLIELLGVIVIIVVLSLIAFPLISNQFKKNKTNISAMTKKIVEEATNTFVEDDPNLYVKTDGNVYCIPIQKLVDSNHLSTPVVDPSTGKELSYRDQVKVTVENSQFYYQYVGNETCVEIVKEEPKTFMEVMNGSSEVMSIDPDHNPRYVGANPSNYVWFNNELWRIIGVFNGQAKIIRNEFYSESMKWNSNEPSESHNSNDWSQATLQTELNGTYLNSINSTYKAMIDGTHVWNLGSFPFDLTKLDMYNAERGTEVLEGNPTVWTGAIGLLYASDYGYSTSLVDEEFVPENNWLYIPDCAQWTLSIDNQHMFGITNGGNLSSFPVDFEATVRPVLYLKNNVKIKSGTGSSTDPFQLIQEK